MAMCMCYALRCLTEWNKPKVYFGMTEVRPGQTKRQAGDVRLRYHVSHPLKCMSGTVVASFCLEPLGHLMTKENCFLQEAINTAIALHHDSTARGACYSCEKLCAFRRESAAQVRKVVVGKGGQEARDALKRYVATLEKQHPVSRHVRGQMYKDPPGTGAVELPITYRIRKSGTKCCETRRNQMKRGDYSYGSRRHVIATRGRNPEETVSDEDARRPNPRQSGRKRRLVDVVR